MSKKEIYSIENKINNESILFFDFDGTIIDTNYANFLAYQKSIQTILNKSISFRHNKRFTRDTIKKIFPELKKETITEIIKKKDFFYNLFLSETKPNKAVCEILNKFSKTNITVLVTKCRKDRALSILNHYEMETKFSYLFFKEINDTKKTNKFQKAISKLGVSTLSIFVFENEDSEILDAVNAGIPKTNIVKINNL